jgi:hypothetical protein
MVLAGVRDLVPSFPPSFQHFLSPGGGPVDSTESAPKAWGVSSPLIRLWLPDSLLMQPHCRLAFLFQPV